MTNTHLVVFSTLAVLVSIWTRPCYMQSTANVYDVTMTKYKDRHNKWLATVITFVITLFVLAIVR